MKKLLIMGLLVGTLAFVSACGTEPIEPLDPGTDEPGVVDELPGDDLDTDHDDLDTDYDELDADYDEMDTDYEDEDEVEVEDDEEE